MKKKIKTWFAGIVNTIFPKYEPVDFNSTHFITTHPIKFTPLVHKFEAHKNCEGCGANEYKWVDLKATCNYCGRQCNLVVHKTDIPFTTFENRLIELQYAQRYGQLATCYKIIID